MALKIYSDAAATLEVLSNEVFSGTGAQTSFALTSLIGADVGNVYVEDFVTYTGDTFTSGVSSALAGAAYTVNELVGRRVYHNSIFVGTITSNTVDTVTIDDLTYSQTAFNLTISTYTKKTLTTHYSISGNNVVFVTAPTTTQRVHVVPDDTLNVNFGGNPAAVVTTTSSVWLKRTAGFTYDTLKFYIEDLSAAVVSNTDSGITFASGVGSGFTGLVADALIGLALDHKGVFRGLITANTTTTITISDLTYTDAVAGDTQRYSVSQVLCSLDNVTFKPVMHPAAINNDTAVRVYLKDTVSIPNAATNYPNLTVRVSGIEYLA